MADQFSLTIGRLENMVKTPTWKEVLFDLVIKNKIDPWDVDVSQIARAYLKKVKEMRDLELTLPANIILAASILLRFQSDQLKLEEEQAPVFEEVEEIPTFDIPNLEIVGRIPPKRKITLPELINAVEVVFEEQRIRNERYLEKHRPVRNVDVKIEYDDLKKKQYEVYSHLKQMMDDQKQVLFSQLIKQKKDNIVLTLLYLLFLSNQNIISVFQEVCFGEIVITVHKQDWTLSG